MRSVNAPQLSEQEIAYRVDQRTVLHGITWPQLNAFIAMKGDAPIPRLAYLDGELELSSPATTHEWTKTAIGRLVEAWAEELGVDLDGMGSWTLMTNPTRKGAIEPDECYVLGALGSRKTPDLAIEVVVTHGGIDKLEIYRRLGVPEVWRWVDGKFTVHTLEPAGYVARRKSRLLPQADLALFARCLREPSQTKALKKLRAALRSKRPRG